MQYKDQIIEQSNENTPFLSRLKKIQRSEANMLAFLLHIVQAPF